MKQIKSGKLKMHSKLYFLFGSILFGFALAFILAFSTFFINLFIFRWRTWGFLPPVHWRGWLFLLISLASLILANSLLRQSRLGYRKNFLNLIFGLTLGILLAGFLLNKIGLNERLEKNRPLNWFYQKPRMSPSPQPIRQFERKPSFRLQ